MSPWIQTQAPPHTITSDGATVFYFDSRVLLRADIPPASSSVTPEPVPVTTVAAPAAVTSLEVDDRCVYWVERDNTGAPTIMKRSKVP
ncbi:MAG: hypothetical protein NVS3B10_15630 [Polyangiales bacterium]